MSRLCSVEWREVFRAGFLELFYKAYTMKVPIDNKLHNYSRAEHEVQQ